MNTTAAPGIRTGRESCVPCVPIVPTPYFPGSAGTIRDANAQNWDANATAAELLAKCQTRDIVLQANAGQLDIDAPAGELTPELLQALRTHKAELLELLASGPQDLQPPGNAAGPSGTDRPAGQALPGAGPLGANGSQDDHGDAGQAHGDAHGAAGSQDLAATPQAMAGPAGPRTRPAVPVAVEWPAAAADFALLLAVDALPPAPFRLNPWTVVQDAGRFLAWLRADIRRGPAGPRAFYGALQCDLQALARFALASADYRQRSDTRKAGEA